MDQDHERRVLELLRARGIDLGPGLGEPTLKAIEAAVGAPIPPDWRAVLAAALPLGEGFPDWRSWPSSRLEQTLAWPWVGLEFDLRNNVYWMSSWGARPESMEAVLAIARRAFESAPQLLPLRGHRYLPCTPELAGNPVLSVYQTDVICYGADLIEWLTNEFPASGAPFRVSEHRRIPFWSDVIDGEG